MQVSEPCQNLRKQIEPCDGLWVLYHVRPHIHQLIQVLIANMLYLLVNFLIQACKVPREISPWETGVATGLWEAIVVIIGLLIIWLVGVLTPKESDGGAVTYRALRLVARAHRLGHTGNIHVRVDHDRQYLGCKVVLVRIHFFPFDDLGDLLLKPLLVPGDL